MDYTLLSFLPFLSPFIHLSRPQQSQSQEEAAAAGGLWFSASSVLSLQLSRDPISNGVALIVFSEAEIYEERKVSVFVLLLASSVLHGAMPIKGSRVVFGSYRERLDLVQKFAMRSSASSDSETFMNSLKELKNITTFGLTSCNIGPENSPPIQYICGDGFQERDAKELSNENPLRNYELPEYPPANHESMQYTRSKETVLDRVLEPKDETLPASSIILLSDSCIKTEQEIPKVHEACYLKSQTVGCMSASAFSVILGTLELFIDELGGDMTL